MLINRQGLDRLLENQSEPCVSIFLPTVTAGPETRQNAIRFKNLLGQAKQQLDAVESIDSEGAESILRPGQRLVDDYDFWQRQSSGLAVYLDAKGMTTHHLPIEVGETVVLAPRPYIQPLIPLVIGDDRYYVLAISPKKVRLFEGSRDSLVTLDVPNLPTSLEEALGRETDPQALQFHSAGDRAAGPGGPSAPIYHGQGGGTDDQLADLRQFLHRVDDAICGLLNESRAPMVIASVDRLAAEMRQVSDYPNIVDETLSGNPDQASAEDLQARAWPIVEPIFDQARDEARRTLEHQLGTDRVVIDQLERIVREAAIGRVETLFVKRGDTAWGSWDPDAMQAELHDERRAGDRDLVDEAAAQALDKGSDVFVVDEHQLPADAERIVALLRY